MRKFIQKKLKEQKGMTLIELLAVIVILAIIAAIAIPAIGGIIENSRVGAAKSDALNVLAAAELYVLDHEDAFTEGKKNITGKELIDGNYMKDTGTFKEDLKGVTVTVETTPGDGLELSGTATAGDIVITFENATKAVISAVSNSDRTNENTLTIDKP